MNLFKRGIACLFRRFDKTLTLLSLIIVLGTLTAGGISIRYAIIRTEENLRRTMPPITSIEIDWNAWDTHVMATATPNTTPVNITADLVHQIGTFADVHYYNYSIISTLFSFDFEAYTPAITGNLPTSELPAGVPNSFDLTGVSNPDIMYISQGLVSLVSGRVFQMEEMQEVSEIIPVVMSQPLALANQLALGSTFTLANMIPNIFQDDTVSAWQTQHLFAEVTYLFEIVGLFEMNERRTDLSMNIDADFNEWNNQWRHLNTIYLPSVAAEAFNRFAFEETRNLVIENQMQNELVDFGPDASFETSWLARIDATFILADPLKIDNFKEKVQPLIPAYYLVMDLSNRFATIQAPMAMMRWIADAVLTTSIIATILMMSLTLTLFLIERRYEMGIYLALGEKKLKIILQLLLEIMVISTIGITSSIFIGNITSAQISQFLLQNQLTELATVATRAMSFDGTRNLETLGFLVEMTPAELMANFDVSLTGQVISLLYGIGFIVIFVATIVPVMYLIRLNPKKILLDSST